MQSPLTDASRPLRSYPLLAWLVLLGVIGFILVRQALQIEQPTAAWLVPLTAQARMLVGLHNTQLGGQQGNLLFDSVKESIERDPIDETTYSKRLRLAILSGELVGPDEALRLLTEQEEQRQSGELPAAERSILAAGLLQKLYRAYEQGLPPSILSEEQQALLRSGLGWFGELALAPAHGDAQLRAKVLAPARRALVGYFALLLGGCMALLVGLALLIVFVSLASLGRLTGWLCADSGRGGLYAETFAVYMLLYLGIGFLFKLLPESWHSLGLSGLAMLLSLLALVWPMLRGVSLRQVRQDLGLTWGQSWLEVLLGFATYLCAIPVLAVAVVVIVLLSQGRPSNSAPTHPAISAALESGWWVWVQLVFVACVVAPLVEEIMFRGALYRHLREATGRWSRIASVAFAGLMSSFIFAVIHPQGWLAVPALGGLALIFAVAREWRQSLIAPMVAHGLNNFVTTAMLLLMAA